MLIAEEPEVSPPPMLAVVMPKPCSTRQNATTEAQVHPEAGCGAVRTDARMRRLHSSGRRSTESDEATLRRMQGTHGRAHAARRRRTGAAATALRQAPKRLDGCRSERR